MRSKQLITKDMTIAEIVSRWPETIPALMKYGMHCIGCPMAMSETLEQAVAAHDIPVRKIIEELNSVIKKKKR